MKVAINATPLIGPRTGVGRYVAELVGGCTAPVELLPLIGLRWAYRDDRHVPVQPSASRTTADTSFRPAWRARLAAMPCARRMYRSLQQQVFNKGARRQSPALYHEPGLTALDFDGPIIVTAHDASWVRHPEAHPVDRVRMLDRWAPRSLERAHCIIVDSAFVGRELQDIFGVPAAKLRTIPLGVSAAFCPLPVSATAPARALAGLRHQGYILAVGTLEPRKNLHTLLIAYAALSSGLRQRYPLVIAGQYGWGAGIGDQAVERLRRQGCLHFLGHVHESLLPGLYAGAALFAYPSLYEGFGLPPLEALACGVPVIVSDRAALPEVVGAAARQVPALDVAAWREAITALLEDGAARATLARAGPQRAAAFTWAACVGRTAQVYQEFT